jgi:hypothetical protein
MWLQVRPLPEATILAAEEARFWAPSWSWMHWFGFQCQGKTPGETRFLTSMLVKEGSLGPRVPVVSWRVQMPHRSPWGLVGWVGVGCECRLESLVHMLGPSFEAVSTMVHKGSVLQGSPRTIFGGLWGCREVGGDIVWLGRAWFGVGALLLCHVGLGSEASKHCRLHSKSVKYGWLSSQYHCF